MVGVAAAGVDSGGFGTLERNRSLQRDERGQSSSGVGLAGLG